MGVINKNMTMAQQAREVERVKRAECGMTLDPLTVRPDQPRAQALEIMREHGINGVVEFERPVGILTARNVRFEKNLARPSAS